MPHYFLPILTPSSATVTLCHISRDPPKVHHSSRTPQFLVVQKTWTKTPCTKYLSMVRGVFVRGFCSRWFLSIPLLSEYLHYNRKLTTIFNFTFHKHDNFF